MPPDPDQISQAFPTRDDLEHCLIADRYRLDPRIKGLRRRERSGQPYDQGLVKLWREVEASRATVEHRRRICPATIRFPAELPVSERRHEVARLIAEHQVVVLCGETGSGKSTQLPKICLDLGRGLFGRIGHTQPRRIAARSLASRVAQELGGETGGLVGYKVRFKDRVRPETRVKLMTDGILLAEIQHDRVLREYDTLIIDEAHERSLNIDFLLGYLGQLLPRRPDLKVIVTSATIDPDRFAAHFADAQGRPAPVIEISGRTFPVEVRYRPPQEDEHAGERDDAMQQAISHAVAELAGEGRGDVLVFLSGEREIRETAETLRKHHPPSTEVLPLYARQGPEEQARVFRSHATRRVVLATNVAETSLTVPGIHYVIDPGFARISRYSHRGKVQRLPVERVSQASASQRKGRCGRVASGICIRLYSEDNFGERAPFTEPEIQRTNLAAVILQMKVLGFGAIESFPFIDPPEGRLVADGYQTLVELGAIDSVGAVTTVGRRLARLPVDPRIGRMLLAARSDACVDEVLIIASALGAQDPRERPLDKQQAADEIHATFAHPESDFLTFINLWQFLEKERRALSHNQFRKLCQRHFLSRSRVQEWHDIHSQLLEQMAEMDQGKGESRKGHSEVKAPPAKGDDERFQRIHRALLTGLLCNIGQRDERDYLGARNSRFYIHPSSALFKETPKWIVAAERVETTRQYGRIVARVQPGWIEAVAGHLLQRTWFEPHWQSNSGQVAAFERVTLFGVTLVARRRVNYGPINPAESREIFIRFGLVAGDFDTRAPFWRHNRELIEYVQHLEAKSRRRDILVDEEAIATFYNERIPEGIYSKPQFEKWLRRVSAKQPKLLHMRITDVMRPEAAEVQAEAFPDSLRVGASALPLEYHFDPGHRADGLTLVVPLPLVNQVSPQRLEWLVPGLLVERITAMMRGLPKPLRRQLVPVPDTAERVAAALVPSDRPLVQALGEALKDVLGIEVPESAWDSTAIPEHLRMKVRLVDEQGGSVAFGEDLVGLKREHGGAGSRRFSAIPVQALERTGITRWTFGDLPERVDLDRGGIRVRGYPALVDERDSVAVQVLDSPQGAERAMRAGLRRLLLLHLGADARRLRKGLPGLDRMRLQYAKAPVADAIDADRVPDLADELVALALDLTFVEDRSPIRTQTDFERRLAECRGRLFATAGEVCTLAGRILDAYQSLRGLLVGINQARWRPSVDDIRHQLDRLVFRGFLIEVPFPRLREYPRYLKAAEQRAERLPLDAARDRQRMDEMAELQARWEERIAAAESAGRDDPRLDEIRWMLEELRVSFFAQQLRTAYPVSLKRIQARWRELGL